MADTLHTTAPAAARAEISEATLRLWARLGSSPRRSRPTGCGSSRSMTCCGSRASGRHSGRSGAGVDGPRDRRPRPLRAPLDLRPLAADPGPGPLPVPRRPDGLALCRPGATASSTVSAAARKAGPRFRELVGESGSPQRGRGRRESSGPRHGGSRFRADHGLRHDPHGAVGVPANGSQSPRRAMTPLTPVDDLRHALVHSDSRRPRPRWGEPDSPTSSRTGGPRLARRSRNS